MMAARSEIPSGVDWAVGVPGLVDHRAIRGGCLSSSATHRVETTEASGKVTQRAEPPQPAALSARLATTPQKSIPTCPTG